MSIARITVRVQPRASRTEVAGMQGENIRIRLAAPPVDNAANEALVEFIADALKIPKRQVRIASGATSRTKHVVMEGMTTERALELLLSGMPAT